MGTQVNYTPDFSVDVGAVNGACPAGELYAKEKIAEKKIPVFSCEGACIRGEIARQAANLVVKEVPSLARACHAETFFVPHSSMTPLDKGCGENRRHRRMFPQVPWACAGEPRWGGKGRSHRRASLVQRNTRMSFSSTTFQKRSGSKSHGK